MPQDAFSLLHTSKELNKVLTGSKINKITQPTVDDVILTVFTGEQTLKVILSANAVNCRVAFLSADKPNPSVAPNFCMLLRKHLLGATITKIELVEFERIIKISLQSKNDFFETVEKELYVEIMGKYSNIILTTDSIILGCLKQSSLELTNLRPLLSGMKYILPPPQDKVDYRNKEQSIAVLSTYSGDDLPKFIFSHFKGICSFTAEEIAYEYALSNPITNNEVNVPKLYDLIYNFIEHPNVKPCTVFFDKKSEVFISDYKSIYGERVYYNSILDAISNYYEIKDNDKSIEDKKRKITSKLSAYEKKIRKKLQIVLDKELSCKDMDDNRIFGELLTANLYKLKGKEKSITVENYYDVNYLPVKIQLDSTLSPSENAQRYFKKYQKQKKTIQAIKPQKEEINDELDYISTVYDEIEKAENIQDFNEIEEELSLYGIIKIQTQKKKEKKIRHYRQYNVEGYVVKVGKNNLQNQELTDNATGNNVWLHTKDFHSAHVIIESKIPEVPETVIKTAAEICVYYSSASGNEKVPVDFTLKKFVKNVKGSKAGFVQYSHQKTCFVNSNKHEELVIS